MLDVVEVVGGNGPVGRVKRLVVLGTDEELH